MTLLRVLVLAMLSSDPGKYIQLKLKGLFSRGTFRKNRKHVPKCITFTKADLKTAKRYFAWGNSDNVYNPLRVRQTYVP